MDTQKSSRLAEFYKKSLAERGQVIREWAGLTEDDAAALSGDSGLSASQADVMIENAVGTFALPLGIATNFRINERDYLIPLVVEEPSVVAALSYAAKLFRAGGGFITRSDEPIMIGQIQVLNIPDLKAAAAAVTANKGRLLEAADETAGSILRRGGGARDIEVRLFPETAIGPMLVVHLLFDARDAMGANAINTASEHIAPIIEEITGGRVNLRILSNLTDRRRAVAKGRIPASELSRVDFSGADAVKAIIEAAVFAEVDPYRAATHNKGIMNGIDAIVIATGNDWRAVEAGAHAYAARNGTYTSMTHWWKDEQGDLWGEIEIPLAVGIVGGATRVHPTAQVAMKILNVASARELAEVIATVGLAQNFAAIRALATEGIQQGHMRMHARQLAAAAGAVESEVAQVARQMISEKNIRLERAKELVQQLKESSL